MLGVGSRDIWVWWILNYSDYIPCATNGPHTWHNTLAWYTPIPMIDSFLLIISTSSLVLINNHPTIETNLSIEYEDELFNQCTKLYNNATNSITSYPEHQNSIVILVACPIIYSLKLVRVSGLDWVLNRWQLAGGEDHGPRSSPGMVIAKPFCVLLHMCDNWQSYKPSEHSVAT